MYVPFTACTFLQKDPEANADVQSPTLTALDNSFDALQDERTTPGMIAIVERFLILSSSTSVSSHVGDVSVRQNERLWEKF
jgi:hypothetical protein